MGHEPFYIEAYNQGWGPLAPHFPHNLQLSQEPLLHTQTNRILVRSSGPSLRFYLSALLLSGPWLLKCLGPSAQDCCQGKHVAAETGTVRHAAALLCLGLAYLLCFLISSCRTNLDVCVSVASFWHVGGPYCPGCVWGLKGCRSSLLQREQSACILPCS